MPKLSKEQAGSVAEASSSFEPLEDGVYHVQLEEVTVSDNPGPSGSHYWKWQFAVVEPGVNGKLWTNTSLSAAAEFKLNEAFAAFGVTSDTDTDELVGQVCKAVVSTQPIQSGARKGELGNQVDRLVPADDDFEAPSSSGKVDGDLF